jgi:homoserine dehydrogenase
VYNAVLVRSDIVGDTMYYGQGAGADATASAVLADIADAALNLAQGVARRLPAPSAKRDDRRIRPIREVVARYYLRMTVEDRAGVLAQVSGILGRLGISIASVWQQESARPGLAPLILLTHDARYGDVAKAIEEIDRLDCIRPRTALFFVEEFA